MSYRATSLDDGRLILRDIGRPTIEISEKRDAVTYWLMFPGDRADSIRKWHGRTFDSSVSYSLRFEAFDGPPPSTSARVEHLAP